MGRTTGSDSPYRDNTGWSATEYRAIASYVYSPEATGPILQSLGASPGDKVLDLGCGSGEVTAEIARLVEPDGIVVGVDSSEDMVDHYLLLTWYWILTGVIDREGPRDHRASRCASYRG
jgi:SAM-dependent methyltransferase